MEIKCKFEKNLPETRGQGKNGEWVKNEFVCETDGQYPKKLCFSIWGDKSALVSSLKPGEEITVKFDPESREYNGRYFTELKAFSVETNRIISERQQPIQAVPLTAEKQFNAPAKVVNDLPF